MEKFINASFKGLGSYMKEKIKLQKLIMCNK